MLPAEVLFISNRILFVLFYSLLPEASRGGGEKVSEPRKCAVFANVDLILVSLSETDRESVQIKLKSKVNKR